MDQIAIAGRAIGAGSVPYLIAEIGSNHNGDMELCRRLIDAAHAAGADAVKFQSWTKASLVSTAEYVRNTRYAAERQAPTLEEAVTRYQMTPERMREVADYCRSRGITWLSSCFSASEVALLETLECPAYKIASMDVTHLPLLRVVAATGKPVLLSVGMATMGEVDRAVAELRGAGCHALTLLHCVSLYPSPPSQINLLQLDTWRRAFDVPVGYSDHSLGTAVPLAAVALGACIIEKHFTLDRALEGWDHAISADPGELHALSTGMKAVAEALGTSARLVSGAEVEKRQSFRRGMVMRRSMARGERITAEDVDFKRPGTGISPDELQYVAGRRLARDVATDDEVTWADLE